MLSLSLKRLRENAGLTQQQVADILNIDRSTYAYYETGKTYPSITSLKKLAKIFNVNYDVLIDGTSKYVMSDNRVQYKTVELSDEKLYSISKDEKMLVTYFRLLSPERQDEILKQLADETDTESKKTPGNSESC